MERWFSASYQKPLQPFRIIRGRKTKLQLNSLVVVLSNQQGNIRFRRRRWTPTTRTLRLHNQFISLVNGQFCFNCNALQHVIGNPQCLATWRPVVPPTGASRTHYNSCSREGSFIMLTLTLNEQCNQLTVVLTHSVTCIYCAQSVCNSVFVSP